MQSGLSRQLSVEDIGVPVLRSNNIVKVHIDLNDIKYWYLNDTKGATTENYFLKKEDLLVNFINSIHKMGKCAVYNDELERPTIFTTNLMRLNFKNDIDTYFIYYFFNTTYYKNYIDMITKPAVNQASFTTVDFKKMDLKMPNIEEQKKISLFLKRVDNKIELLEHKYQKYQDFKKYLMQQIFTQKLRFANFNEEYNEYSISDLFTSKKGSGLSKDAIEDDGANKCVLYGELYTTYSEIIDQVQSKTNSECNSLSKKGDILIPASTTTKGIDLVTASVILEDNIYLGGDITILRNKDESIVNNSYFAYYFTNGLIKDVSRLTQGSTIIHLYWKDFKKVNVKLPSINEQEKIANMFVDIDRKLNEINYAIETTHKFKRGLLQQMFV
ncbi:MAG: restriction endonuclease subunit S [Methanobrevibacter sp.]|nr:restriction endonuclease subunit S [Methanobrevibacter sp.]